MSVTVNRVINFTFRGLCAPVFTVFNNDLSINTSIIPKYAQFLAKNEIKGILVNGTTGEGMSMSVAERKSVAEEWAKAIKTTKQHIMVHVGGCPLPDVADLAEHAEKVGVNSILCLPELYNKPSTPADLINYLKLVSEAAPNTPLLYYHNPAMSKVTINMAKFLKESYEKIDTFVGLKFTSNDLDGATAALKASEGRYTVFIGSNSILPGAFVMGIDSAIPGTINMFPQYAYKIKRAIEEGKIEEAKRIQNQLTDICTIVTKDGSWVPTMKTAMSISTPINVGKVRPPLKNLTDEQIENMKKSLKKLIPY